MGKEREKERDKGGNNFLFSRPSVASTIPLFMYVGTEATAVPQIASDRRGEGEVRCIPIGGGGEKCD